MKDCEKMIVVAYVNTSITKSNEDFHRYMSHMNNFLTENFDDSVKVIILPTQELSTHIEALNTKYISEEETKSILDRINKHLDSLE